MCNARSPVVDGIVRRNAEGKEVRFVTKLSEEEMEISRRVCMAFGQNICGFDLLRSPGRSPKVIDVNGWSFVKGNREYADMCATKFREMFLKALPPAKRPSEIKIGSQWTLKSFICVLRHADRTPKQKIKFHINSMSLLPFMKDRDEIVVKNPLTLQLILDQLREELKGSLEFGAVYYEKLDNLCSLLAEKITHRDTKLQLKIQIKDSKKRILIIVKWGGEFTHAGRHHSKGLGENMRKELLLLNKEITNDIKIFTSSERRAVATAEVFTKAFLPMAQLPPGLLKVNKKMLDDNFAMKENHEVTKKEIQKLFNLPENSKLQEYLAIISVQLAMWKERLQDSISCRKFFTIRQKWCCSGSALQFKDRWDKLFRDLSGEYESSKICELYDSLKFDAIHNRSLFETVFCDGSEKEFENTFKIVEELYKFVSPREYGIEIEEKFKMGCLASNLLLSKIVEELESSVASTASKTRLFFTKESHMFTLLNFILYCGLDIPNKEKYVDLDLDYLSQISFELFERSSVDKHEEPKREYSLRVGLSLGAFSSNILDTHLDSRHCLSVLPRRSISEHTRLSKVLDIFKKYLQ